MPDEVAASLPSSPAADELARQVAVSLAGADGGPFAKALAACVREPACYEASVRGGSKGMPTVGRMLIEQVSNEVVTAIAHALDVTLPPEASRWLEGARAEGVPLFGGWDLRGGGNQRCVKLYLNTSDASRTVRAR